jgi:ribosome-binding protein aMBF1 (putative translation factor)
MNEIAARIRNIRRRRAISILLLATETKIDSKIIRDYDSGCQVPSLSDIQKLATALGVSPTYLAFGHEDKTGVVTPIAPDGTTIGKTHDVLIYALRLIAALPQRELIELIKCYEKTRS